MLEDVVVLAQFGAFSVTSYSLCMAGAALLGILLTLILHRKQFSAALSVSLWSTVGAVLGGHLVWCLFSIGKLPDYTSGMSLIWQLQLGGYSLAGAVAGGLAALSIYGAITHQPILPLFDMAVPGSMATLCVGRLAECFTSQGLGDYVE